MMNVSVISSDEVWNAGDSVSSLPESRDIVLRFTVSGSIYLLNLRLIFVPSKERSVTFGASLLTSAKFMPF